MTFCETPAPPRPSQAPGATLIETARRYQSVLALDPRNPEALIGISLVALASQQTAAAIDVATVATSAAPEKIEAWIALAHSLAAAKRYAEAEQAYISAIRLDGTHALIRIGLGELRLVTGRPAEALAEFELALRSSPGLLPALLGAGNALAMLDRDEQALARYMEALSLAPQSAEVHFASGFALARLGRSAEAEARYRHALFLRPDFASAWLNLGALLREEGRESAAEAALERAAQLRPELLSAWLNLALLERGRKRPEEADKHLRRAHSIDPGDIETLLGWCQLRLDEGDREGAWQWLERAIEREPAHPEVLNTRGILLHSEGRFEEAVQIFEKAEDAGARAAASNRGNSLVELGRIEEGLRAHEKAVSMDPRAHGARYNLALTQLRAGEWASGWANYESRWNFRDVHRCPVRFEQPRWPGEPLNGRAILLHAEQGLGDTIQFCRYAQFVAERGGVPILAIQPAVERLIGSLAVVRSGLATVVSLTGDASRTGCEFDVECPLMSLPAVFATTPQTVPWPGAYLAADPTASAEKHRDFPSRHPGPRIGIAWAGNPNYKDDRRRSIDLSTLLPLLAGVEANWISLQKGEAAEQIAQLPAGIDLCDGASRDRDLADTAALIETLDLVITTDTSIAHLAGAMAKPVWILLPHLADWRWMQLLETTPWYPTARLFRQPAPGDWASVVAHVFAELGRISADPARKRKSR